MMSSDLGPARVAKRTTTSARALARLPAPRRLPRRRRESCHERSAWLVLLLVLAACGGQPEPSASAYDPLPAALEVAAALTNADAPALAGRAHSTKPLRIELRETLVETDERTGRTLAGSAALTDWLEENRASWSCSDDDCRWPGGLVTEGAWSCFGDCCDLRPAGGMELRTLYFRRVCLAHREAGRARLSLLVFYEAR